MILQALAVRSRDALVPQADTCATAALALLLATAAAARGEAPAPPAATTPPVLAASSPAGSTIDGPRIVVAPTELADGWIELTPLEDEAPPVVFRLGKRSQAALELWPPLPEGRALACTGDRERWAVSCREVALVVGLPAALDFEGGLAVTGVYRAGAFAIAGAAVGVVPVGIDAMRPFVAPLGPPRDGGGGLERRVETDAAGRFRLPRLAPGEYFLETLLPGGRLHRSPRFAVAGRAPARAAGEAGEAGRAGDDALDLGEIDVAEGLDVEVAAVDPDGEPIAGALVRAVQGYAAHEVEVFAAATGRDGVAVLSGFALEPPTRLACERRGRVGWEARYEAVPPARVECVMARTATVAGEVLAGGAGEGPAAAPLPRDATLTVTSEDGRRRLAAIDARGRFEVVDLAPGGYGFVAAAPGYRVDRREAVVAAGELLDLGTLVLLPGRTLEGRVVEAGTGAPLAGVEVLSTSPPGAVVEASGAEGEFTLADPGDVDLEVVFVAPRHVEAWRRVSAERFLDSEPLVVELAPGGWIRAVVRDGAAPCFDCRLEIEPGGRPLWTDLAGEALSPALAPGRYKVLRPRVLHLGTTVVEEPEAEAEWAWVEAGKTTTVAFGGRRAGIAVELEPAPLPGALLVARSGDREASAFAGADGVFLLRLRPGETPVLSLRSVDPRSRVESLVRFGVLPARIDRQPLRLALPRTAVSGVATSDGGPLAGSPVRLLSFADFTVWATSATDRDGRFAISGVAPGVYALLVGGATVQHVALADGRPVELGTYALPPGGF